MALQLLIFFLQPCTPGLHLRQLCLLLCCCPLISLHKDKKRGVRQATVDQHRQVERLVVMDCDNAAETHTNIYKQTNTHKQKSKQTNNKQTEQQTNTNKQTNTRTNTQNCNEPWLVWHLEPFGDGHSGAKEFHCARVVLSHELRWLLLAQGTQAASCFALPLLVVKEMTCRCFSKCTFQERKAANDKLLFRVVSQIELQQGNTWSVQPFSRQTAPSPPFIPPVARHHFASPFSQALE